MVCYGHLTVSLNPTLNSDLFIMKPLFLIHLTFFFFLLLLFLALSRGSECMPIDSRSRQPRSRAKILVARKSRRRSQRWRAKGGNYIEMGSRSGVGIRRGWRDQRSGRRSRDEIDYNMNMYGSEETRRQHPRRRSICITVVGFLNKVLINFTKVVVALLIIELLVCILGLIAFI